MLRLYLEGKTLQQVGDRFGITRERVRQILYSVTGVSASEMRPRQMTLREMAAKIGRSTSFVADRLKRLNLKPSPDTLVAILNSMKRFCRTCGDPIDNTKNRKYCKNPECRRRRNHQRYRGRAHSTDQPGGLVDRIRQSCEMVRHENRGFVRWAEACRITGLNGLRISYLVQKGILRAVDDPTRMHRVTKKPLKLYPLAQCEAIREALKP